MNCWISPLEGGLLVFGLAHLVTDAYVISIFSYSSSSSSFPPSSSPPLQPWGGDQKAGEAGECFNRRECTRKSPGWLPDCEPLCVWGGGGICLGLRRDVSHVFLHYHPSTAPIHSLLRLWTRPKMQEGRRGFCANNESRPRPQTRSTLTLHTAWVMHIPLWRIHLQCFQWDSICGWLISALSASNQQLQRLQRFIFNANFKLR